MLSYDHCFLFEKKRKQNYKTKPRLPWITKSLLRSINRKNRLFYKYKTNQTFESKQKYIVYRNILTSLLRRAKKDYYLFQFNSVCNNVKGTWKVIRNVLNVNPKTSGIPKLVVNEEEIEDKKDICEAFNECFSNIGVNLSHAIPDMQDTYKDFLDNPNPKTLFLIPVVETDVLDIVSSLKRKKSPGYDGISNDLLKEIIQYIVRPLTHIYNLSIVYGIVPDKMKIAKVVPIFKKGNRTEIGNYRPISLLTVFF